MLNIVIPMAGLGGRFSKAGFQVPKPLIPVHGVPMIRLVIDNVRPSREARFIFICQSAQVAQYDLRRRLTTWAPGGLLIELDGITAGAASTVLTAMDQIDSDVPLMIANSDQYVDISIDAYLDDMEQRHLDGLIMTMTADDPKWSFAAVDDHGFVTNVEEKNPISNHATVGIYNFRHGRDFVRAAQAMIAKDLRVNGEFYVAPVYNQLVGEGARIGVYDVGVVDDGVYGLGTPDDLAAFLARDISRTATQNAR